ncbi:transcriptional regulator [Kocuria sp.]|uniref:transcriptional regulator n=1 Tax=Kocuria sp. TaxID=1871328 RepID=UPI0026DFA56B|nr:transcriptional regulator [Kocuria sp.]MDO5617737.1 transcriptional regulator [Kocuria sp.]
MPYVVTADRRDSRSHPGKLDMSGHRELLQDQALGAVLDWQVASGDELQALYTDPEQALHAVLMLVDAQDWHVGVGVGPVDTPLPPTVSEATGPAFVSARVAVDFAKAAPGHTCVQGSDTTPSAGQADAVLGLLATVRRRRTETSRAAADLADRGYTQLAIAQELGITQPSVSRRLSTAMWQEEKAVREVLVDLLHRADQEACGHE